MIAIFSPRILRKINQFADKARDVEGNVTDHRFFDADNITKVITLKQMHVGKMLAEKNLYIIGFGAQIA